ncbi:hypothetical protein PENTCL1PPCAC_29521 [Pristionchus entomophagus]|uniref:7TM GPCR serpentine receptor class x (Srx) domain-containing protein n=1 Tax=Pristionchus entomophagus TaxID=358040 RepID=A0AAV5UM15_9BILA|nr:hypothetical protein PENTCL1PPCAC_29521 [Pristionchus entomophagus]
MVVFATAFVLFTFIVGSTLCCTALWTIHKSPALRESFGVLCKWQMRTDLTLLLVTSVYSLIPASYAPSNNSLAAITITYIAEISYHYSGAMHDLFAVNRFIYIVFPMKQQAWRNATPKILVVSAVIIAFHTIIMTILDVNLHWLYDRETYLWQMTDTPWTEFYIKYFEVYWSTAELTLIVSLDSITFVYIIFKKSKVITPEIHINRRTETRLVLQSFCQCIPVTTVNIIFFFILPETTSPNLKIVFSSIWIVTNMIDA